MQDSNFVKIVRNLKPALLILLVALVGAQTLKATGAGARPTAPARKAELASAAEAKRVLAKLGSKDFSGVRDPKMRAACWKALGIFKAIAANTAEAREAGLLAQLDRSIGIVKAMPQPTGLSIQQCDKTYQDCVELCKLNHSDCKLCGLGQNGCYLNVLADAISQEGDPSKD